MYKVVGKIEDLLEKFGFYYSAQWDTTFKISNCDLGLSRYAINQIIAQ